VEIPSDERRRLLNKWGASVSRVKFVIEAVDDLYAHKIKTALKSALHDSPDKFAQSLRANGLLTVTGVKEVPVDHSTSRKTLEVPSHAVNHNVMDQRLAIVLVVSGFLLMLTVVGACYAVVSQKKVKLSVTSKAQTGSTHRDEDGAQPLVMNNMRSRRTSYSNLSN